MSRFAQPQPATPPLLHTCSANRTADERWEDTFTIQDDCQACAGVKKRATHTNGTTFTFCTPRYHEINTVLTRQAAALDLYQNIQLLYRMSHELAEPFWYDFSVMDAVLGKNGQGHDTTLVHYRLEVSYDAVPRQNGKLSLEKLIR